MSHALTFVLAALCAQTPAVDAGVAPDAAAVTTADAGAAPVVDIDLVASAIKRMQRGAAALKDFTATFHKHEYKGKQLDPEVIELKYRTRPRSLYFKWIGKTFKGQEVLWQKDWNGERIRAHPNSFPDITVNLEPTHWLAMRYTRHETPKAGFDYTIEMFARDLVTGRAKPECVQRAEDGGEHVLYSAKVHCYELETDKAKCPELYSRKARLCLYEATGLPAKVEVWDWEDGALRQVEDYGYADLKVDVGLTDADFDPGNDKYDF